jgi:hypothetical protein
MSAIYLKEKALTARTIRALGFDMSKVGDLKTYQRV